MGRLFAPLFNIRSKLNYLICFIIIFSSLSSALSLLFAQDVYADSLVPMCDSGHVEGDSLSSSFKIVLYCQNINNFASPDSTSQIFLQPSTHSHAPLFAVINGDLLELTFYTSDGSVDRDISIGAGALFSSDGSPNPDILVATDSIVDYNLPYATDKYYDINQAELNISAGDGLLKDAFDAEGALKDCLLSAEPTNGTVTINSDGSFTYIRNDGYYGDDQFSYFAIDGSDNSSNEAIVRITDAQPEIIATLFYRNGTGDRAKAKVGDVLRVDVETSEVVALDNMVIAGNVVSDYSIIDDTHYCFQYTMQSTDIEGFVNFSLLVRDLSGKEKSLSSELGLVVFNKTPPVISLNGDVDMTINIHDSYLEEAIAIDPTEGGVALNVSGSVNVNIAGDYILTYGAVDSFGNQAIPKVRTVHVVDVVAIEFDEYSRQLREMGFENNLNLVNTDNITNFTGLYFERISGNVKIGRITFDSGINLTRSDILDFILSIDKYMTAEKIGEIGLDFANLADDFPIRNVPATIKFYNLNRLGYTDNLKADDVFLNLAVFDHDESSIDRDSIALSRGLYFGCQIGAADCYTYVIQIKHFTKFIVNNYVAPITDNIVDVINASPVVVFQSNIATTNHPRVIMYELSETESLQVNGGYGDSTENNQLPAESRVENRQKKTVNPLHSENGFNLLDIAWHWWFLGVIIVVFFALYLSNRRNY